MQKIVPLVLLCCAAALSCLAQAPMPKIPYPNGEVKALAAYGDTIIVGGQFSEVYTFNNSCNNMGVYDTLSKTFLPASIKVQNGMIKKVIPDENNTGYYVAGNFTMIGDSARKGIAHIDTTGKVTSKFSRFNPFTASFNDLYLRGDTLLAAGKAIDICSSCTQYKTLTAINTTSGQLTPVLQSIDGQVNAITADGSGGWYLGGTFNSINGVQRYHAARIDSLGNVLPWNPVIRGSTVYSIYKDTNSVFIGGAFDMVSGTLRNALAEVDTLTGIATSYNPKITGSVVMKMTKWGNKLVIGGSFYAIGDSARQNFALIDLSTHRATSVKFNTDGGILAFALSGNTLYMGGTFFTVNGTSRQNLASINLLSGTINSLTLNLTGLLATSFTVLDLKLYSGQLYLSGQSFPTSSSFTQVAGVVGINATSGAILHQYTVAPNAMVESMAISGTTLYAMGNFTTFNTLNRNKIAAINLSTNTVAAFDPLAVIDRSAYFSSSTTMHLGVLRNGSLFVTHEYPFTVGVTSFNNGFTATGLIGFHTSSDSLFTMSHQLNGEVNAMTVSNDTLYIGGAFTLYARNRPTDSVRVNFAGISLSTLDPTNAYLYVNAQINALLMYGTTVVAGGSFSPAGLTGYDIPGNSQLAYSRPFSGTIRAMALHNSTLYLAGYFNTGVGLIATDAIWWGNLIAWSNSSVEAQSVAVYNNKLYACATFSASGPIQMRTYNLPNRTIDQTITIPQGAITSFCSAGPYMKMWGTFLSLGGIVPAKNLFAYAKSTGNIIFSGISVILSSSPADAVVNDLLITGNTLYVGGIFNSVKGNPRNSLASISLVSDTVTPWNPSVNGMVLSLEADGSDLYVAGYFDMVGLTTRQSLCSFNLGTGALSAWNPMVIRDGWSNPTIKQVKTMADRIFIAGGFSSINGTSITSVAAFSKASGSLLNWNPSVTNGHFQLRVASVSDIVLMGSYVYALSETVSGQREVWSLDINTASSKQGWRNPRLYNNPMTLVSYRNGLFIPGVEGGGMLHMDTVSGNTTLVTLSTSDLTRSTPMTFASNTLINTILIDSNDRMTFGGNFAVPYYGEYFYGKYLAETGISTSTYTMTVSSKGLCFDKPVDVKVSGFDSTDNQTYVVELALFDDPDVTAVVLGTITLPSSPSLTFTFPSSYGATSDLKLRLVSFPTASPTLEVPYPVRIGPGPVTPMLGVLGQASVCEEKTVTLQGTDLSPLTYTFNWTRNDTLIPDVAQSRYITSQSGTYRMFLTNSNGCYDSSVAQTVTISGHCAPPSGLRFKNVSPHAATLLWNKGSGARSIVIARADVAVTAVPQNGTAYIASPIFAFGQNMGDMNYVVYNGSRDSVTVTGLDTARTYFFTVIEYDDSASLSSYITPNALSGSITTPANIYYAKSTGMLNVLSTWGINPDGSGASPTSFTHPALYKIRLNPSSTLSASWMLGNEGCYVELSDTAGGSPKDVIIPAGMQMNGYGLQVTDRNRLTVTGSLNMNTVWASDSSTVIFNGSAGQVIPPYSYSRLQVVNAAKTTGGPVTITDSLSLASAILSAADTLTLGTPYDSTGILVRTSGYIEGPFRRWIHNIPSTGNMGLLPTGADGKYQPLQLNFITVPSAFTHNINIVGHFIPGMPDESGLPLTDQGITVNTIASAGIWKLIKQDTLTGLVYKLTATANDYAAVNDYAATRLLFRNPGSTWQSFGDSAIITGTNLSFTIAKDSIGLFGEFGIGSDTAINALPVKSLTFTAKLQKDKSVQLSWQTASELNSERFDLERAGAAGSFTQIASLKGQGTTSTPTYYQYQDATAFDQTDILYYRLKQTDHDGQYTYSNTIAVSLHEDNQGLSLSPNPANNFIALQGLSTDAVIRDMLGTELLKVNGNGIVDISSLRPGVYVLHAGEKAVKFVKY